MATGLRYRDAAKLLGGSDDGLVAAIDRITGGILLGAAVTVPAVLGWLDFRAEFAKQSRRLAAALRQRSVGSRRLPRTKQLAAAHTVIVVAAYFEALGEAELPTKLDDFDIDAADQLALARGDSSIGAVSLAGQALASAVVLPEPHSSHEDYLATLRLYYQEMSAGTTTFLTGLAAWDRLNLTQQSHLREALATNADAAVQRYSDLLFDLVTDFPEVAYWANLREHRGTRAEVRRVADATTRLGLSLRRLEDRLGAVSSRLTPAGTRSALRNHHVAALARPITDSATVAPDLLIPSLEQAYVPPPFRVTGLPADGVPNDESRWDELAVREDLDDWLFGHLTSLGAMAAPTVVLGQPGAGKSVLTKIVSGRLPAADFLPIRVPLREVDATLDVQGQIEQAVRIATGDEVGWRALAESADGAVPVIFLDGFDELLQATGVNHSNYLIKVAEFQRREADQGRGIVVIVTTRTSVAHRARVPAGTVLLRLEPFDEPRIALWMDNWNGCNEAYFAARGLSPLPLRVARVYPHLAGQPLLLLLLALYDADANALQRALPQAPGDDFRQGDLYERLLRSFAAREVDKLAGHLGPAAVEEAVERELWQLSVVAFAMHNRASQWVTETELERDLTAIFGPRPAPGGAASFDGSLRGSELLLGKFFFIHRSTAVRDRELLQTYEFLHATFGEYLVARLTWRLLRDAAARSAYTTLAVGANEPGALYSFLSFAALCVRGPVVTFLQGFAADLADQERAAIVDLLTRLYRSAPYEWRSDPVNAYQPARLPMTVRYAAYSANLVLLAVVVSGGLWFRDLCAPDAGDLAEAWHRQALLWHSQLSEEEFDSLIGTIAVDRGRTPGGARDVRLYCGDAMAAVRPPDPHWTFDRPEELRGKIMFTDGPPETAIRLRTHFQCGTEGDMSLLALLPLLESELEPSLRTFVSKLPDAYPSAAQALLKVLLLPASSTDEQRWAAYRNCAIIAIYNFPTWDERAQDDYAGRLLSALAADASAPVRLVERVLKIFINAVGRPPFLVADAIARCVISVLNRVEPRGRDYEAFVATVLDFIEGNDDFVAPELVAQVWYLLADALLRARPGLGLGGAEEAEPHLADALDAAERIRRSLRATNTIVGQALTQQRPVSVFSWRLADITEQNADRLADALRLNLRELVNQRQAPSPPDRFPGSG